jgi:hypothetical protein
MADLADHNADPGDHDADLGDHDAPILLITMDRRAQSRLDARFCLTPAGRDRMCFGRA